MLKKSIVDFDENPFTEINDKWGIVTAGNKETGFNAMTVSWGGVGILWNKPVVFLFIRKSRYTYEFLEKSDSVTVSFLGDEYHAAKTLFGRKSGRDTDKFKETGLHPSYDPDYDGYYIEEAEYVFKCKKLYKTDIDFENMPEEIKLRNYPTEDMHTMYVCEIRQYLVHEND